jgi:hypothetical protein
MCLKSRSRAGGKGVRLYPSLRLTIFVSLTVASSSPTNTLPPLPPLFFSGSAHWSHRYNKGEKARSECGRWDMACRGAGPDRRWCRSPLLRLFDLQLAFYRAISPLPSLFFAATPRAGAGAGRRRCWGWAGPPAEKARVRRRKRPR